MLVKYAYQSDNPMERKILKKFDNEDISKIKVSKRDIENILSDDKLRNILETSLMYRECFCEEMTGDWSDGMVELSITKDKMTIVLLIDKCEHNIDNCPLIYIAKEKEKLVIKTIDNERKIEIFEDVRFFADTDWKKIRRSYDGSKDVKGESLDGSSDEATGGANNQSSKELNNKIYHVIAKNDDMDLYIKLNRSQSLADKVLNKEDNILDVTMRLFFKEDKDCPLRETLIENDKHPHFCEKYFRLRKIEENTLTSS